MAAIDRVREKITLIDPDGLIYDALWQGSPVSAPKKLGIFSYPGVPGEVVQDLEINSDRYSMTIFFEGEDHDEEANDFWGSLKEKGQWQVIHPIHGDLVLQLIDYKRNDLPVADSNRTSFDLNWIEPANILITISEEEVKAAINAQGKKTNESFLDSLKKLKQDTFSKIQAAKDAIDSVTNTIDSVIGPIAQTVTELNDAFNQIVGSIQNLLDATVLDPLLLLGQITNLVQLPLLAVNDFQSRMDSYVSLAEEIFGISPSDTSDESFNVSLVQELTLGAIAVASAQITASSEFQTRSQVIDAIDRTNQLLLDITNNLDATMFLFRNKDIDDQYFSLSSSFIELYILTAQALRLLILSIFDLSVEKRFKLEKKRSPVEIVISEYGEFGENDILYDLFITSNKLKSNEILLLPEGREVVIYV